MTVVVRGAVIAALSLALLGCSGVCGADRLPACDVREESCHPRVIAALGCLRGETVSEPPPVSVVTPAEFEMELRAGVDPMMMETLQLEGALQLLGLLPPGAGLLEGQIAATVASTAAYFSPVENAVYVIDRGEPLDSPDIVSVLLHEMVHAAQHEEHDLNAALASVRTHEDLSRLRLAIEGEATLYQIEATLWSEGRELTPSSLDFEPWVQQTREDLDANPAPYLPVYGLFPYVFGSRHATAIWASSGDAAVRSLVRTTTRSSEFMQNRELREPLPPPRLDAPACAAPPEPSGFALAFDDEMGPLLIYAFLRADRRMTHAEAWAIAYRWRRDDLHVYVAPDGQIALAWRIHMSDTSGPRWTAVEAAAKGLRASADGEVVTIVAGAGPDVEAWTWSDTTPGCAAP